MTSIASTDLNTLKLRADCSEHRAGNGRAAMALPSRALLRLESAPQPRRLLVTRGQVWATLEGSQSDVILRAGDAIDLPARGLVIAEALADSTAEVQSPCCQGLSGKIAYCSVPCGCPFPSNR